MYRRSADGAIAGVSEMLLVGLRSTVKYINRTRTRCSFSIAVSHPTKRPPGFWTVDGEDGFAAHHTRGSSPAGIFLINVGSTEAYQASNGCCFRPISRSSLKPSSPPRPTIIRTPLLVLMEAIALNIATGLRTVPSLFSGLL